MVHEWLGSELIGYYVWGSSAVMSADTALSLNGYGRLDYSLKPGRRRDILLAETLRSLVKDPAPSPADPSSLEIRFRSRSMTGTLLHVQESSNYTTVKVSRIIKPTLPPPQPYFDWILHF